MANSRLTPSRLTPRPVPLHTPGSGKPDPSRAAQDAAQQRAVATPSRVVTPAQKASGYGGQTQPAAGTAPASGDVQADFTGIIPLAPLSGGGTADQLYVVGGRIKVGGTILPT